MTLPFGGAHGSLTAITHTKINTKIAPAKKCNFQQLTVNTYQEENDAKDGDELCWTA